MKKVHQMVLSSVIIIGTVFAVSQLAVPAVQAQEPTPTVTNTDQAVTVATVGLYNGKIVSQEGNVFKLQLDFYNRENAQPGIHYSIQLTKQLSNGQKLVDEEVYPNDVFSLQANESVTKQITYKAPSFLQGDYSLTISAFSEGGMSLAFSNLGNVTLTGNGQYLEMDPGSCYLNVQGDKKGVEYSPMQGVDISQDETLIATCLVTNHFNKDVSFIPSFVTYRRVTGGDIVTTIQPTETISVPAGISQIISISIPKPNDPQAYDTVMTLKDNNTAVSNNVTIHYVIQGGARATIQNVRFDKTSYQQGNTAAILFSWSGTAGYFPGARIQTQSMQGSVTVKATLMSDGKACANPIAKELTADSMADVSLQMSVTSDCQNPSLSVSLVDGNGKVLDSQTVATKKAVAQPVIVQNDSERDTSTILYRALGMTLILIIIVGGIFFFKKRKNQGMLMIFVFFLMASNIFINTPNKAKADTWSMRSGWWTLTADFDKRTYSPGQTMKLTAQTLYGYCSNHASYSEVLFSPNDTTGGVSPAVPYTHLYGKSVTTYLSTTHVDTYTKTVNLSADDIDTLRLPAGSGVIQAALSQGTVEKKYFRQQITATGSSFDTTISGGAFLVLGPGLASASVSQSIGQPTSSGTPYTFTLTMNVYDTKEVAPIGQMTTYSDGQQTCYMSGETEMCDIQRITDWANFTGTAPAPTTPGAYNAAFELYEWVTAPITGGIGINFTPAIPYTVVGDLPCTLPWGGTIASGQPITAYQLASVSSPATCTSETRTCTNGVLSGSYTNQSCAVVTNPCTITYACLNATNPVCDTSTCGQTLVNDYQCFKNDTCTGTTHVDDMNCGGCTDTNITCPACLNTPIKWTEM